MYHISNILKFVLQCAHMYPSRQNEFDTFIWLYVYNAQMSTHVNFLPNWDNLCLNGDCQTFI